LCWIFVLKKDFFHLLVQKYSQHIASTPAALPPSAFCDNGIGGGPYYAGEVRNIV